MFIIPRNTKISLKIFKDFGFLETLLIVLIILIPNGIVSILASQHKLPYFAVIFVLFFTLCLITVLLVRLGDGLRGYQYFAKAIKHLTSTKRFPLKEYFPYVEFKDELVKTKQNNYILTIELLGMNFLFLNEETKMTCVNQLTSYFNLINQKMTFLKLDVPVNLSKNNAFLKSLLNKQNQTFVNKALSTNEEFKSKLETRYFLQIHESEPNKLEDIKSSLGILQQIGLKPKICTEKETTLIFKNIFFPCLPKENTEVANLITTETIDFHKDYYKITTPEYSFYGNIFTFKKYPLTVNYGWLNFINRFQNNFIMQIETTDKMLSSTEINTAISDLDVNLRNSTTTMSDFDLAFQIESLKKILERVQSDEELLKRITCHVQFYNTDFAKLKEQNRIFMQEIEALNYEFTRNLFVQRKAFINLLPKNHHEEKTNNQLIPNSSLSASFPFTFQNVIDDKGFLLGTLGRENGYCIFDINNVNQQRTNSNMFILGGSGSGKSFTTKKLLFQLMLKNQQIIILDPEREYIKLCNVVKGSWIDVGKASHNKINPLQIFTSLEENTSNLTQHYQFLEQFFKLTCPEITDLQSAILINFVKELYKSKSITNEITNYQPTDWPIFTDLIQLITSTPKKDRDIEIILTYLSRFDASSVDGQLWNGYTTLSVENRFTVIDLYTLIQAGNQRIINAQMFLMLKFVENEVRNHRLRTNNTKITIAVDEAHLLIDRNNPISLHFMYQMVKRIRKYNGNIIIITQNINDFLGDETIKKYSTAILNNCQYSLFFKLNSGDINDLNNLLSTNKLSLKESRQLEILNSGECLFRLTNQTRFWLKIIASNQEFELFKTEGGNNV